MPLHHPPGHAQVDFGEAVVELQGRREKVAFFCLILPHSDVWFVKACPRETTQASHPVHEMIEARDENGATIVTSNLPFQEWTMGTSRHRARGTILRRRAGT